MRCRAYRGRRGLTTLAALALLAGVAGCGSDRYPVTGRVMYEDGIPVTEGNVIGHSGEGPSAVTVQGSVQPDGTFEWGTDKPGDGARPGKYRVAVIPRGLGDAEMAAGMLPAVDSKFEDPKTSGIEFEVKPQRNELNITVTKPKKK
ncbi:MAG TPA: hypothetical protein VM597_08875 [Gemmataceae bacterium]|nr:hypothetical protein [Gemmataceae bacterium]